MIICKSPAEISKMREAGKVVASALKLANDNIRPGLTTIELEDMIENLIINSVARPAFKGYHGYPASICASVNDEVVHCIPSERTLKSGDILSVDVGVELDGYFGDAAKTFAVGEVTDQAKNLMDITEKSLYAGIEMAKVGNRLSDISHEIQLTAESAGYTVVREYVGHGIGSEMHEDPQIPNFGPSGNGPLLKEGMVIALEPMVNVGDFEVKVRSDEWTVVTADGSLSAHFEHSVALTKDGPMILTK